MEPNIVIYSRYPSLNAGGSSRRNADITFTRQVPKFLQPHAHLLGAGRNPDAHDEEGLAQHARNSMQFKDDDEFEKRDEVSSSR